MYIFQYWYLTANEEIRRKDSCFDYASELKYLSIAGCHGQGGNQRFVYKEVLPHQLYSLLTIKYNQCNTNICIFVFIKTYMFSVLT